MIQKNQSTVAATAEQQLQRKTIKCIVWDLDNTLWHGVLLEDQHVSLRPEVVEVIKTLDSRGILHAIASKNDYATAMAQLERLGISQYFLYPQINWNSKSSSLLAIAQAINIGIDTLAFVDDQAFEREEVAFSLPDVLCIDASNIAIIPSLPEMQPRFVTTDSQMRRALYQSDIEREKVEKDFIGSKEEFLATLDMVFTIAIALEEDLQRAEELTVRTHQLNTTGYTYSYEELAAFRNSSSHKLFISSLEDKYGSYGKIGLTLLECQQDIWTIKLLLMSCRVMSRGVGTIMINHVLNLAQQAHVRLQAEFLSNDRNRMMYVTYKFAGFREIQKRGEMSILECEPTRKQPFPSYIQMHIVD